MVAPTSPICGRSGVAEVGAVTWLAASAAVVSIVVKEGLYRLTKQVGEAENSP